ncbi:nucleotidyltransferase [Clostridium tertium]|uniref:tRNA(Met) cytidine acetate ligase n=1 Tax=Clostridium tertium TaxID=1559 RepID=A0A6N2ZDY5_9CLOT
MNITGIITEYNPFHNGHLYHLNCAKKDTKSDGIVCVMSGNFVQRGEPSIIDKWKRAEMAVLNGVDLVIELPTFYALSSAEFFAKGSISILNNIGVVDNLFFGSECGDVDSLYKIAKVLTCESDEFKEIIKKNLEKGLTYVKAREIALVETLKDESLNTILSSSNNILGIEYIKAIIKLNSNIKPMTLKREGSNYNDSELNSIFSSATSIRNNLKDGKSIKNLEKYMPKPSIDILENLRNIKYPFVFSNDMFPYIRYKVLTNCINFNNISEIKEGLDNKIIKEIINSKNLDEFILNIKSKRYTYTKISRILSQIFISLDNYDFISLIDENNLYARVLAFNDTGKLILKDMKKKSSIPIITNLQKNNSNPLLSLDIQSSKAYSILNNRYNPLSDFLTSPIIK